MPEVNCDQYTPAWWEARKGIPTASEFHRIITDVKGEYAAGAKSYIAQLIADKYNPWYPNANDVQTSSMQNGSIMEPRIRKLYKLERMCELRQIGFWLSEDGRLGCSPDSFADEDGVLEIKAPEPHTHVTWLLAGTLPKQHRAQCHGHLIVTGRKWCDFVSHCDGFPDLVVRVEPDLYTEQLRECLGEFLRDYDDALEKIAARFDEPVMPLPTKTESFGALGTLDVGPYDEVVIF